jgi:branched-chain amino acid transport system ATP-binding protein
MRVGRGEMVGVLGANGAGKTTLLRTIAGALRCWTGTITVGGLDLRRLPEWERVKLGLAHVPEGRRVFPAMTVEDNLLVAALVAGRRAPRPTEMYELFPVLGSRRRQLAGTLSGGEQQMLAIGRALMTRPAFLLVDEMSAGLAPVVVQQLVASIAALRDRGDMGVLVVEQSPQVIASVVDRVYLFEQGEVVGAGALDDVGGAHLLADLYLGVR